MSKDKFFRLEFPDGSGQRDYFVAHARGIGFYTILTPSGTVQGGKWALPGDSVYEFGIDRNKNPAELYFDYEQHWEGRVRRTVGPMQETRENIKWLKQVNKMYPGYFVLRYVHLTAVPDRKQWREVQPIVYRANDENTFYEGASLRKVSRLEIDKGLKKGTVVEVDRKRFDLGDTVTRYDKLFLFPSKKMRIAQVSELLGTELRVNNGAIRDESDMRMNMGKFMLRKAQVSVADGLPTYYGDMEGSRFEKIMGFLERLE